MANLNTDLLSPEQAIEATAAAYNNRSRLQTKTYYVSNNGLDTNDGLTHLTPFKTIAKVDIKKESNVTIYLECGSIFYEPYGINYPNHILDSYGVGKSPIIDGSSVINTPVLVSGNVYETTNTYFAYVYSPTNNVGRPILFENGVAMQPVGTLAECEALPNSYVTTTADEFKNGTYTIRFHTSDSSNPNLNLSAFRTNVRDALYNLGDSTNARVNNVIAQYGYRSTTASFAYGERTTLTNLNARWGSKHNIYIGRDGLAKNCIAYSSELQGEYGRASSLFVAYASTGLDSSYTFEDCAGFMTIKKANIRQGKDIVGFLEHVPGDDFEVANILSCYLFGVETAVSTNAKLTKIQNCFFENITYRPIGTGGDKIFIDNSFIQGTTATYANINSDFKINKSTLIKLSFASMMGKVEIKDSILYNTPKVGTTVYTDFMLRTSPPSSLSVYNTVIFNYKNQLTPTVGNYKGDYNVFYGPTTAVDCRYGETQYTTLATWQTATGQDVNSVFLTDAQSKTFFLTDPNSGAVSVNPYATVTGGNGTIYTGTFPDGTLLSSKIGNKNYTHIKSKYTDESSMYEYKN